MRIDSFLVNKSRTSNISNSSSQNVTIINNYTTENQEYTQKLLELEKRIAVFEDMFSLLTDSNGNPIIVSDYKIASREGIQTSKYVEKSFNPGDIPPINPDKGFLPIDDNKLVESNTFVWKQDVEFINSPYEYQGNTLYDYSYKDKGLVTSLFDNSDILSEQYGIPTIHLDINETVDNILISDKLVVDINQLLDGYDKYVSSNDQDVCSVNGFSLTGNENGTCQVKIDAEGVKNVIINVVVGTGQKEQPEPENL